jgi:signal transduction histidine kinase
VTDLDGRLPEILDSVAGGVTVLDRSGTVRFANDTAARLLGLGSASEVIGKSGAELTSGFELLDADGKPLPEEQLPTRRVLFGEDVAEAMVRFRRRGSTHDRFSTIRARLLRGERAEDDLVVTAFTDISSLKRSEARLRFIAEASAILGESVDYAATLSRVAEICVPQLADWCVVDVLEGTAGIHRLAVANVDPQKSALAEEMRSRWPPDLESGAIHRMLQERRPVHLADMTPDLLAAAARDDEHLALLRRIGIRSVLVVPMLARGEIVGALSLLQAESERRFGREDIELSEELGRRAGEAVDVARLLFEAREIARNRDEFLAVASHDMRTPLAAVRGYAQLGRRQIATGEPDLVKLDGWLAEIDGVVGRLDKLVGEMLDTSLIHGGRDVPLKTTRTDLRQLGEELLERLRPLSPQHRFVLDAPEQGPAGEWDPDRLERVLQNLLDNAIKFSPDGGEIRLRIGAEDEIAYAAVSDQGVGIPAAERELIFSARYRGMNAGGITGTGIGLAGSRRLVEQMGGMLTVDSRVGAGSTFSVRLPL